MAESIAFFEGNYMPLKEAKISIADPAVTKSDIVFDVVSVTGGLVIVLPGSKTVTEALSSTSAGPETLCPCSRSARA